MITPLVSESDWISFLQHRRTCEAFGSLVLVVVPHPDDETLSTGGLIAALRTRGTDVLIVAVTDGENAYENSSELGVRRQAEQAAARSVLGVNQENTIRLGLPDSDVAAHEQELVDRLLQLVSADTHILAPWVGDFHPDHEACGRAAATVAHLTGARITFYFFWMWHRGTLLSLEGDKLSIFPLDQALMQKKARALQCHESQLNHPSGEPILRQRILAPARRPFEVFLTT